MWFSIRWRRPTVLGFHLSFKAYFKVLLESLLIAHANGKMCHLSFHKPYFSETLLYCSYRAKVACEDFFQCLCTGPHTFVLVLCNTFESWHLLAVSIFNSYLTVFEIFFTMTDISSPKYMRHQLPLGPTVWLGNAAFQSVFLMGTVSINSLNWNTEWHMNGLVSYDKTTLEGRSA